MNTNLHFDAKAYYMSVAEQLQKAIDFVYPGGNMRNERAHGSFMEIQGIVNGMRSVTRNLNAPVVPTEVPSLSVTK
jgi:hypothetical protein